MTGVVGDGERDVETLERGGEGLVGAREVVARGVDAEDAEAAFAEAPLKPGDEGERADAAELADLEEVDEERPAGGDPLADRLVAADPRDPGRERGEGDVRAGGAHAAGESGRRAVG
jgi:hypothetical protein